MRITDPSLFRDALDQQGIPFQPRVNIRASYYEINAINMQGGRITSLMGRMTSGRGRIGGDYKIPLSLYAATVGAPDAAPRPPRVPNQNMITGHRGDAYAVAVECRGRVGSTFAFKGHRYTITGFNPQRPKNAVAITREDGRTMKCSVSLVNSMIPKL